MESAREAGEPQQCIIDALPVITHDTELMTINKDEIPASPAVGAVDDESAKEPGTTGVTLTDQTNFLPTRQVITVFMGLSVALACAFLDQTM